MEVGITDSARSAVVEAAVAQVGNEELKAALALTADPRFEAPTAVANALRALRKHRDPTAVVGRPQYRAALPDLAAAIADACLARTIEVLGDHSDDPTREQLLDALDQVRESFSEVTMAVMLASVADGGMPASDLCYDIVTVDGRFGLAEQPGAAVVDDPPPRPTTTTRSGVSPEQRQARRAKKQKDADERRRKLEAAAKAAEQVRRERKKERSTTLAAAGGTGSGVATDPPASVAPRLNRRAALTPLQEEEFDRFDPWAGAVVFVWVPFGAAVPSPSDPSQPDLDGKSRRSVVVAGSATHLLVRPGYSEGGAKRRDWKSVPLRQWKRAGFDRPTWIDSESIRVPRHPEQSPVGWLAPEDWNALW